MRRKHLPHIRDEWRAGNLLAPVRAGWRSLAPFVGRRLGQPISGPLQATIIPTYDCNLSKSPWSLRERVHMADMDGLTPLSVTEMERVIDDLVSVGTTAVDFSGGEPLLCRDTLHYIRYAHAQDLLTYLSTNGLLVDHAMAERIVETAVDAVEIAVDGLNEETHDGLRGHPGAFHGALGALDFLSRVAENEKPELLVSCVLCEANVGQLPHIAEMVLSRGADHFSIRPEHKFELMVWGKGEHLKIHRSLRQKTDRVLDELIRMGKQTNGIDSSTPYLHMLKSCIRGDTLPIQCYAGYTTYVVDCYGQLFPCMGLIQQGRRGQNIRDMSLRRYWYSPEMARLRRNLADCRMCYSQSQTQLDLLYSPKSWLNGRRT